MADDEEDESSRELSSSGCPWPTYIAIDMIELVCIDDDERRQATTTATTMYVLRCIDDDDGGTATATTKRKI